MRLIVYPKIISHGKISAPVPAEPSHAAPSDKSAGAIIHIEENRIAAAIQEGYLPTTVVYVSQAGRTRQWGKAVH